MRHSVVFGFAIVAMLAVTAGPALVAQTTATTQPAEPPAAAEQKKEEAETPKVPFKPEELEQIVAPIALYPDSLLAQVLMASTYPLEIVLAARWSKEHPQVKGDAVATEMAKQTWDPSVKSLVAFPEVLTMMSDKLEWTQKLGDAFLAQRKEVMDAVQRLRVKAKEEGNLKSSKEQTVKVEPAPAGATTTQTQTIIIESSNPEVIYVPTYNPTVVYGAWPYPAYPPYSYYPPGYVAGTAFFSFSMGMVVGGALWGGCNWGYGDVDINVNRYNNFNRNNIDVNNRQISSNRWEHNSQHRQGVGYRDSATQQKYGRGSSAESLQAREQFRGRTEQELGQRSRDGAGDLGGGQYRDLGGGQARDARGSQMDDLGASRNRDLGGAQSRVPDSASRYQGGGAFNDVGNASRTRASSSRGMASRGGMSRGGGRRR